MSLTRILAILVKDLRAVWLDGRIVVLLLMPIGFAVIATAVNGGDERPLTTIAVVESDGSVTSELGSAVEQSVELELEQAESASAARQLVADRDVEAAIVVLATSGGQAPRAEILVAEDASPSAQSVIALVPDVLAGAAGLPPTAQTQIQVVAPADQKPFDIIDQATFNILFAIVFLVVFVAMMVLPMQIAEELEKGTFGALRLAATGPEILSAKAISGFVLALGGAGLTLLLTGAEVAHPALFFGAALALVACLVGFGLLMGLLLPDSNALNTYGGFFLAPLLIAAMGVFAVDSGFAATILDVLPFSQAAELLADGISDRPVFDAGASSWLVIAAWASVGYAALLWIASRREL